MNDFAMPHNQLIMSTGETNSGILFVPFSKELPSDYTYQSFVSKPSSVNRAPISSGSDGWAEKPDTGGTNLSVTVPIGGSGELFLYAALYCLWKYFFSFRQLLLMGLICFSFPLYAGISALRFSPSAALSGQRVTITPTITSVPEGDVSVCWGVYYDAECTHEVDDILFYTAPSAGANSVSFPAPPAGTYYIKTAIHAGKPCKGLLDSYYTTPMVVYPADADLVLSRDAQGSATRTDITDDETIRAYGAMRFSRSAINNEELSVYERYNYFISFPFDVQVGDIYGIGTVGTHWRILYYDGKGRAENGFFAERTDNWVMIDDTDSILHAGQGYLLQLNAIQMAEDHDEVWVNDADVATLFFPSYSMLSELTTTNETIPALSEAYRCTIDLSAGLGSEGDRRTKDSYWRCIGVPSFSNPTGVSGLPYLYAWDPSDNSLAVVSSEGLTFEPMQAYLVQNGGQIIWTDVIRPAGIAARPTGKDTHYEIPIEIRQASQVQDRLFVRLTEEEQATEAFDFGLDLIKEMNADKTNIYTLLGYERLAANCLPMTNQVRVIPLGVQIATTGEYMFVLPTEIGLEVTLLDHTTGLRTKLNAQPYVVELEAGKYDARFALEVAPKQQTPTETEAISSQDSAVRKVLIDGQLYIIRDGRVYDALGRMKE